LINHIIKIILLFLILQTLAAAQQDSLRITSQEADDTSYVMTKSPWTAVLLSAAVPGLGQIYNESYIKAPIVWGIGFGLAAAWIFNNERYWKYADLYAQNGYSNSQYLRLRNDYRDQRDLISIYMGLAYLLNLVDAYVDAQLFDFTVEEDYLIDQTRLGIRVNF
jgi:hypothetical protein